ncbi:hypothetical protein EON65_05190 [archaeon]|nr:MAG: hypothetical protein EON65_05190 [archaeon]
MERARERHPYPRPWGLTVELGMGIEGREAWSTMTDTLTDESEAGWIGSEDNVGASDKPGDGDGDGDQIEDKGDGQEDLDAVHADNGADFGIDDASEENEGFKDYDLDDGAGLDDGP